MAIKIKTDAGMLDLGTNPSVQMKFINPFLVTDEGSNTVPQTFPFTENNKRIMDFPSRLDRLYRFRTSRDCTFLAGAFSQKGLLKSFQAPPSDGIVASVYFDTGYLYAQISDEVQLPDIDWEVRDPYAGTSAQKVAQWMSHLNQVMNQQENADYHVFSVVYSFEDDTNKYSDNITSFKMLNAVKRVNDGPMVFAANESITETDSDGSTITYPVGYGVTPFLKLSYVLRHLISYYGYSLQENIFDTDPDLCRLVVLNNTADAIMAGTLNLAQLVPDVSVKDFMEAICKKFGCEFIGNSNTKTVQIITWKSVLSTLPNLDLSNLISAEPEPEYVDPTYMQFTEQKSLERASTEKSTWDEMLKKYVTVKEIAGSKQLSATSGTGLMLHLATGQYYLGSSFATRNGYQRLGSDYYDIIPSSKSSKWTTSGVEEISSSIESVPMVGVNPTTNRYLNIICPYIGEIRNKNTSLSTNGTLQAENEVDLNAMLCFSVPGQQFYGIGELKSGRGAAIDQNNPDDPNITYTEQYRYYMGSSTCYNFAGKKWGSTSLKFQGTNGLVARFYQERSDMLRYSNYKLTLQLNISFVQLQKLVETIHIPKWFRNQQVLIESLTVDVDDSRITGCEMVVRTYRKYKDFSL